YKMDRDLMAAHASAPWIVTWDDHEVDNNYAGDFDERGTPPELFVLRRGAGYQAHYETKPPGPSAPPAGGPQRLSTGLHFGSLVDFNALDTRQWRSDQACGDGMRSNCVEALDPARTMMGAEQEQWLYGNLADARARWTVIGQQVPTFARDFKSWDADS